MSEPAIFALIRDGKKSYYGDNWSSVFLFREILWGPEDFEKWVSQLEPLDDWYDDYSGGAVVDFDQRLLAWTGDNDHFNIPKVAAVYQRLLQSAWPRFTIHWVRNDLTPFVDPNAVSQENDQVLNIGYEAIEDAKVTSNDEPDEPDEDDEDDGDDEVYRGDPRAWVTVIDAAGAIHHRELYGLPRALLSNQQGAVQQLVALKPAEVPPEAEVIEGIWIDQPRKAIGVWGRPAAKDYLPLVQAGWPGWNVRWADRGYAEQCHVSGPGGTPLTETDALAKFLPMVLSTKRFDASTVMGFLGGQLKRTAMKATGCLMIAMCAPVLLFGLISGNWRAALITCAIVCAVVMVLFKALELGFTRSMRQKMRPLTDRDGRGKRALVAGPLDEEERRRRIDQLLMAAGFPPLKMIEPSFAKDGSLEMLEG